MPESQTRSVGELLAFAIAELGASSSPRLDAELFLADVTAVGRAALLANPNDSVNLAHEARFRQFIAKRRGGVPVAYLLGHKEFWSLDLQVTSHTLIPRPETELLVEKALEVARQEDIRTIADLGTGCGAIALALAVECPAAQVVGIDISEPAISVANRNAVRLAVVNTQFLCADWYGAFTGQRFELITANPPYVANGDPALTNGDIRHEPRKALMGGADGLHAISQIIRGAGNYLRRGGWLMLEHGDKQGEAVRKLLTKHHFSSVTTFTDLSGRPRVTSAVLAG